MSKRVTIEIPDDLAAFAEAKVSAGEFASVDEAIAAGVQSLKDHDAMIDRWLKQEVIPTYERWKAGLEAEYTMEEVFGKLAKRREVRAERKAF
jgi:antitoxin ParD1/3/4